MNWFTIKYVSVTENTDLHRQRIPGSIEVLEPAYSTSSLSLAQTH